MLPSAHRNNVDFLRFMAAVMVWYSHCFALFLGTGDGMERWIPFESFGSLGVTIFFIISGYFITASAVRNPQLKTFARNRALRILPALIVVVVLAAFVLGPLVSTLPWSEYFSHPKMWKYLKTALVFQVQYTLPGVFADNPAQAVNGSLWSLQHEVRCYIIIGLLAVIGWLRPRVMVAMLAALFALRVHGVLGAPMPDRFWGMRWEKLETAVRLGSEFAIGSVLYWFRQPLLTQWKWLLLAVILAVVSCFLTAGWGKLLFDPALAVIVLSIGLMKLPVLTRFSRYGDFSYGMYLYAFPMQQLAKYLFPDAPFSALVAVSFLFTLCCAVLSWRWVEKPALSRKDSA